jgi:TatD DNase family protein
MSSALPPLDLHAHIDTAIAATELQSLRSVVFAATRSLAEAKAALKRQDNQTIWGVGCHPAIGRSHESFDVGEFRLLASATAFVSEVGLDGTATVSLERQGLASNRRPRTSAASVSLQYRTLWWFRALAVSW